MTDVDIKIENIVASASIGKDIVLTDVSQALEGVNFNREQTDFSQLQTMAKEFQPFYAIWTSIDTFQKKSEEFKNVPLSQLNG